MADQVSYSCRACGATLIEGSHSHKELCDSCAVSQSSYTNQLESSTHDQALTPAAPYGVSSAREPGAPPALLDPDRPQWGPVTGLVTWLLSIAATLIIPVIAGYAFYFIQRNRGVPVPELTDVQGLTEWFYSPDPIFVMIASSFVAHLITLAICWIAVTRIRSRPFWARLGWNWGGKNFGYWLIASLVIIYVVLGLDQVLVKFVPQSDTPFNQVLRTSEKVRLAVAAMAVLTAPLVEELVYRGVLFSGLRRRFSMWTTIAIVTLIFAGVHIPQYTGAWASLIGLTLLSFILTTIRGLTKSVLPCVIVHLLYNTVGAIAILRPNEAETLLNIFTASVLYLFAIWYFFIRGSSIKTES